MDHDQLLLARLHPAAGPGPARRPAHGVRRRRGRSWRRCSTSYVHGVNAYIAATQTDPGAAARRLRRGRSARPSRGPTATSICDRRPHRRDLRQGRRRRGAPTPRLLQYLQRAARRGAPAGGLHGLQGAERPGRADDDQRPAFPTRPPGTVDPATTAMPDEPRPAQRRPHRHHAGLRPDQAEPDRAGHGRRRAVGLPRQMSNALLVDAAPLRERAPDRRVRPPGRLLRASDPDGGGPPRARLSRPRAPPSPAPAWS